MTPLQTIAMGLVLTIADADLGGYDALPDVLGWVLVILGLRGLRDVVHVSTLVALAVLAGLVSLLLLRFEWVAALPESTGWMLSLAQFAFSAALCSEVSRLVGASLARRLRVLRWVFVAAASGGAFLYGGGVEALLVPLAVLTVVANVYLVYLLFRASAEVHGPVTARGGR